MRADKYALLTAPLLAAVVATACTRTEAPPAVPSEPPKAAIQAVPSLDKLERQDFNRLAVLVYAPVFWRADANGNKAVDPDEVAILHGFGDGSRAAWVKDGAFTPKFLSTYQEMMKVKAQGPTLPAEPKERARRMKVVEELNQGTPTLVENSFVGGSAQDRAIVEHVLQASLLIEQIFARQTGAAGLDAKIPTDDPASGAVFYRNQGPWCVAPRTEADPECNASPDFPPRVSGLYPADIQEDGFCEALAKRKDADQLMHQFYAVEGSGADLEAVPYNLAYKELMEGVSKELTAAAAAIKSEDEAPFKAYLEAAAQAFLTNDWLPADEAWSKMNVNNSKWYLRIGPDEVYFEPCSRKAGFHTGFALINQDSLTWQKKLDPVKAELEQTLAELAGKPYQARDVAFHLPDFIDIILNAGDARSPHGATIGQSLPNWGPVANEGRGRTVAMTNLYTDADSKAELTKQAKSILCADTMATFVSDPGPQVMSTVLHEAAHNLGPAHEYKVKGKTASQIFGGPMASTMEELKAQTAALFFTDWLADKGIIEKSLRDQAHIRDLVWAFGHISRGMYAAGNKPKPYSQLAAIQLGYLKKEGVVTWRAEEKAANGEDVGCLAVDLPAFPAAAKKLMTTVAGVKARGDVKGAEQLKAEFVDAEASQPLLSAIQERWLRAPKASFVYSVDL